MNTNSRDIKRRLKSEGWLLRPGNGRHHVFKKPGMRKAIALPHPKKDLPIGTAKSIYKIAGWPND